MIIREYKHLIRLQHFHKAKCAKSKRDTNILSKECENELYVTCNLFLNYIKTKCSREIKKYVEINLKKYVKKYVKKYDKIKAQTAFNV